jgi:uncharacterized membrane protein YkvI
MDLGRKLQIKEYSDLHSKILNKSTSKILNFIVFVNKLSKKIKN